jgi:hypothetical protein
LAREATGLYRALAAQHFGAFQHDLARSASVLAGCLEAIGQLPEAIMSDVEAIQLLTGPFQRHKAAFAGLMGQMFRDFIRHCEAANREPDAALLTPIAEALQTLHTAAGPA